MLVTNPFNLRSMTQAAIDGLSRNWWVLLVSGLLSAIAGGIILTTNWSVADLAFVVGALLVFRGFITVFSFPVDGSARGWSFVVGLLEVGAGIGVWAWPGPTLLVIAIWIGWLLLFRGVMTVSGAVVARDVLPYWGVMLAIGILEVVAASYLLSRPGLTLAATIVAIGVTTMFYGIVEIIVAFEVKNLTRRWSRGLQTANGSSSHRLESATA